MAADGPSPATSRRYRLRDIYRGARPALAFAVGNRTEAPGCLVEQAVNAALDQAFDDAEALLLSRLATSRSRC